MRWQEKNVAKHEQARHQALNFQGLIFLEQPPNKYFTMYDLPIPSRSSMETALSFVFLGFWFLIVTFPKPPSIFSPSPLV